MKAKNAQNPATVGFVALGCAKNIIDSEKMLAEIGQAGFILSDSPDTADVVVINTCGFIKPAEQEALDAIKQALKQKKRGKVKKVIVAGCLAQRMGQKLRQKARGVDAIVGLDARDDIAGVITRSLTKKPGSDTLTRLTGPANTIHDDRGRLLITPPHSTYLRISEGCDRQCSFCTIPAIRGKFRSKPKDLIIDEACELVDNGAVELSIIAQDSSYYGKDLGQKNGLSDLIGELEKIEKLAWIRLMYLYPANLDDQLIQTIAASERIVNYIDMPIQHINNDILKAMHRPDRKEKTVQLIEKLRNAMDDVVLRTTVMTGFPGETDQQFAELLDFIKRIGFDALGCFTFFPEYGTEAAKMDGQIPDNVKNDRANAIMAAQQEIVFEKAKEKIDRNITCLVDRIQQDKQAAGRYYGQAPEIDSICIIGDCSAGPGDFIKCTVIDTSGYDLIVRQIYD